MTATILNVGSDMELPQEKYLSGSHDRLPWAFDDKLAYVQTGAQALKVVSAFLWASGARDLMVPEYLCDSMLAPFLLQPWRVLSVTVDRDLVIDVEDLVVKAQSLSAPFAVLTALYFGRQPDAVYREAIDAVRAHGGIVVDDETHRTFAPGECAADIAVASLRKVLPVADGAYIRGTVANHVVGQELREGSSAGWEAMKMKSKFLAGGINASAYRHYFAASNAELAQLEVVRAPSSPTLHVLSQLDYCLLASVRRANYDVLCSTLSGLPGVRILNLRDGEVPSHLVLQVVGDSRRLQQKLARRGLYCPIHWPPSRLLRQRREWPSNYLSVPVDHRYGPATMVEIGRLIQELVSA